MSEFTVDQFKELIGLFDDEGEFDNLIQLTIQLSDESTEKEKMPDELIFLKSMCRLESVNPIEFAQIKSYTVGSIRVDLNIGNKTWCDQYQQLKDELGW